MKPLRATTRFDHSALVSWTSQVFQSLGLPQLDANLVGRCLVQANLWGQDGHGIARTPIYAERLRRKLVNPRPILVFKSTTLAVSDCDGDNGMGFVVATRAMEEAIAKARDVGIGLVGVRNSTHFGAAAHYVRQAVDSDMVGIVFTNSSPAQPPWGGAKAFFGASPLAAGLPSGHEHPFVLDMATTVAARGKLRLAAQRGEPIEPGICLDEYGRSTTDGMAAFRGVTLPFGGVKGAAIAMLMDLLSGVLTGAAFGGRVSPLYNDFSRKQDVGHFILALRPDLFIAMEEFKTRMDESIALVRNQPLAEGFEEILIPGEPESRSEARRRAEGIPIETEVVSALQREAALLDVAFPTPL